VPVPRRQFLGAGLHLGQQRGRPAAAAHDGVGDDAAAAYLQQVHVMRSVRHAVL
jgi:hypothetical protein